MLFKKEKERKKEKRQRKRKKENGNIINPFVPATYAKSVDPDQSLHCVLTELPGIKIRMIKYTRPQLMKMDPSN